jgi:AGZA family xanthine/uracil permease-like MFS transporter
MEHFFKLHERGTSTRTEFLAGLTTFMTMAYILAVNPNILSAAGMDKGSIFTATALASAVASFLMGFIANLPFVLSAGMGLNAYFAYTVVINMGYSWEIALTAVFVEGVIFVLLSLCNVREAIFNMIPPTIKVAVSVGIGLFIAFIGMQNAHIVVNNDATLVGIFSFKGSISSGTFRSEGITVLLAMIGVLITAILVIKGVTGNILLGILITWVLGMIAQAVGLYVPDPDNGFYSVFPSGIVSTPASMAPTFMKLDFKAILTANFWVVVLAFLFVDMFDTLGTLIGCATRGKMLDKDGKLPGIKGALLSDAVGTVTGACFGTSTITTFVESASGIAEGGRTGLTAIFAGLLFILSLFFSPLFLAIPSFATAPALIIVGFMMMQQVTAIPWTDITEAVPAFLCIAAMPTMYSISEGICLGIISYTLLNLITGGKKKVSIGMIILTALFILKYFLI